MSADRDNGSSVPRESPTAGTPQPLPLLPRGSPRSLFLYQVLQSVSSKPKHGIEILQDVQGWTNGTWRIGVGSVYPALRELLAKGCIETDDGEKNNRTPSTRRMYSITARGSRALREASDTLENPSRRSVAMQRLFYSALEPASTILPPEGTASFFFFLLRSPRDRFETFHWLIERQRGSLSRRETMDLALGGYSLGFERELDWTAHSALGLPAPQQASGLR